MAKKIKPRRKQVNALKLGKESPRKFKKDNQAFSRVMLTLPAPMSKVKIAGSQKEMAEVWQDIVAAEAAFADSVKAPKASIKASETEIRRLANKGGLAQGEKIASLMEGLAETRAALKTMTSQFKATISEKEARASKLQSIIQSGVEYVPVSCVIERNYELKTVTSRREDTGKVVEERPMEVDEMQLELAEVEQPEETPSEEC